MQNKFVGILVCTLLIVTAVLPALGSMNTTQTNGLIPPINDLTGSAGPGSDEVTLTWGVPLFENPNPGETFDATYDFRYADVAIDESNWDETSSFDSDWNPVVAPCAGIELDLYVMASSDGMTAEWDKAHMRAWLTVQFDCFNFYFPGGQGLRGETIHFWVYDPDDNLVYSTTAETNEHGMAEVTTGDLYDAEDPTKPCSEDTFTFTAYWYGHSIGLSNGAVVISTGDREDTKYVYMCDWVSTIPPPDHWSAHGGIYQGSLQGATFQFTVPFEAVTEEVEVILFSPTSVPPISGIAPAVPGHMFTFQLEKNIGGNLLNKPIVITVNYQPSLLDQYDGLAESSLKGYRYDEIMSKWRLLDDLPIKLNREHHSISFETNQLGLFSISAETDIDGDDLGDYEELENYYTDLTLADTDGDGISDGDEAWFTYSDPKDPMKTEADDQHGIGDDLEQDQGYYIAGRIISGDLQSPISNCIYIEIGDVNEKPNAPIIDGPPSGKAKTPYDYTFTSTDPDSDDVSYYIKWGDESTTTWTTYQTSGTPYTESYTWDSQGTYTIEAKAKDTHGAESDWTELSVSMPKNKAINTIFLNLLENYPMIYQLLRQILKL
jgi:hypothetical protein